MELPRPELEEQLNSWEVVLGRDMSKSPEMCDPVCRKEDIRGPGSRSTPWIWTFFAKPFPGSFSLSSEETRKVYLQKDKENTSRTIWEWLWDNLWVSWSPPSIERPENDGSCPTWHSLRGRAEYALKPYAGGAKPPKTGGRNSSPGVIVSSWMEEHRGRSRGYNAEQHCSRSRIAQSREASVL